MLATQQKKDDRCLHHSIRLCDIDKALVRLYPRELAEKNMIIPIYCNDGILCILTVNEDCNIKVAEVEAFLDHQGSVSVHQVDADLFWKILSTSYVYQEHIQSFVYKMDNFLQVVDVNENSSAFIECVDFIIKEAIIQEASDIHFEPDDTFVRIRYRKDGVMQEKCRIPIKFWQNLSIRIKIMSGINASKLLEPKDGRFHYDFCQSKVDVRVSSLPVIEGENIVLRILNNKKHFIKFTNLGLSPDIKQFIESVQKHTDGLYLVTGPTGSGKTTTLYSMLSEQNSTDKKIVTIEDPVEYKLPLVRQTQIDENNDFTNIMKAVLRQDPNIIMIGEIRDRIGVDAVMKAALTGHKIYSSMHANSCFGTIHRLIDFGVSLPALMSIIRMIVAQRLIRKVCKLCCRSVEVSESQKEFFIKNGLANINKVRMPVGCTHCFDTGYNGRQIVAETLVLSSDIREKIISSSLMNDNSGLNLLKELVNPNFVSMKQQMLEYVKSGITTMAEVERVMQIDD